MAVQKVVVDGNGELVDGSEGQKEVVGGSEEWKVVVGGSEGKKVTAGGWQWVLTLFPHFLFPPFHAS